MFNCEICFAILFVAVDSVSGYFKCPKINMSCTCMHYADNLYRITCDSSIEIFYELDRSIKVTCFNLKWSDFEMHNVTKHEALSVSFHRCDLPKTASLKTITDMLGATGMQELYFNSNKNLTSFKRLHLQGFEHLRHLDISYNNISVVDIDLLADLPNLESLDIRRSNIHTAIKFLDYVAKLQKLDLRENNLQMIESDTFDKLPNLRHLFLTRNYLTELQSGSFDKLVNLQILDIAENNLVSLPEDIFGKLKNLTKLHLSHNNFISLPDNLLRNNTKLFLIDLAFGHKNLSILPGGFFSNLTELSFLYLENNGFYFLPENLLWGCFSLRVLYLSKNNLLFLEEQIFRDVKLLADLKLDSNELDELPDYVFANLTQLRTLDLSKNRISSINDRVFNKLYKLKKLNMADNHLSAISDKSFTFLRKLRIANFTNNNLTLYNIESESAYESMMTGINSPFAFCSSLEELYLSNNSIVQIFKDWIVNLERLQILDLKRNYIPTVSIENLLFISRNFKVDLTYNEIQHIFFNYEYIAHFPSDLRFQESYNIELLIDNNPLHCDCALYNYLRYVERKIPGINKLYINIKSGNLTCASPKKFQNMRLIDLQSESFKCATNISVAPTCPVKCNCFRKEKGKVFIIDCVRKNLTVVPRIATVPRDIWRVKLNLSDNQLTQMPNLTELGYGSVSELILSHNNISEISLKTLPNTTQVLELHNNNISKLSAVVLHFLENITNLIRLTLHNNPWICDCNTTDFLDFIVMKDQIIADLHNVTCYGKVTPVLNMTVLDFCSDNNKKQSYMKHIFIFLFVFIVSVLGLFCCMYRHSVVTYYVQPQLTIFKNKLFARRSIIDDDESNEEKLYSAFVSYSQDDHDFVMNELVPELENDSTSLKLCLPYRDWLTNEWTTENIIKSMELSSRMMVVVSPSFLKNVWVKAELRFAHCQALDNNESDVILILYGDVESSDEHLYLELKTRLNSNTYIKWGEPLFWKKLKLILKDHFHFNANGSESLL